MSSYPWAFLRLAWILPVLCKWGGKGARWCPTPTALSRLKVEVPVAKLQGRGDDRSSGNLGELDCFPRIFF